MNTGISLTGPIPAARFWSFTVYDNQTRSLLETDQISAGLDSTFPNLKKSTDGSATIYFGAKAPAGQKGNWIQDHARQGLERDPASVRANRAVAQQDLEAGGFRIGELNQSVRMKGDQT